MIEIISFKKIDKGYLVGSVSVKLKTIGLIINKISVFSKNGSRWINFPQESYVDLEGKKKYFSFVRFENPAQIASFQEALFKELDKIMAKQDLPKQPEPSVQEEFNQMEIPF